LFSIVEHGFFTLMDFQCFTFHEQLLHPHTYTSMYISRGDYQLRISTIE